MDSEGSNDEIENWYSVFLRSFPEHTRFGFSGGGNDTEDVTIVPVLTYGICAAPVAAILLYAMGGLRGYPFLGGWFLSTLFAFGLHMAVAFIQAAIKAEETHAGLREWRRRAPEREAERQRRQAELARQDEEYERAARQSAANRLVDELIAEGENRRLAPLREAQARAQRLATLELALEEAFNRYRFARDVTGTADVNALRQSFLRELQANPLFSTEDMALIATSPKQETRALLPPSRT